MTYSDSGSEEDELLEIPSSEEDEEEELSSTKTSSHKHLTRPTLQLPGGFQWDLGVVKSASGVGDVATSSESEEEDKEDEKEVRSGKFDL